MKCQGVAICFLFSVFWLVILDPYVFYDQLYASLSATFHCYCLVLAVLSIDSWSGDGSLDGGSLDGWPPGSRWKYRGGLPPGECPPKERSGSIRGPVRGKTKTLEGLEAMGVKIYGLENCDGVLEGECVSWDNIAGYYDQKRFSHHIEKS